MTEYLTIIVDSVCTNVNILVRIVINYLLIEHNMREETNFCEGKNVIYSRYLRQQYTHSAYTQQVLLCLVVLLLAVRPRVGWWRVFVSGYLYQAV